jgi:hypothetical protein
MDRRHATLSILIAAVIAAAGCGSDDKPKSGAADTPKSPAAAKPETKAKSAAPKPTSARAKLVNCIVDKGFEVTHAGQDAATATTYTVPSGDGGRATAVIKIHSSRDEARSSVRRAGEERGVNAVPFGRAEFIREAATDTEAGVILNCVSLAYGG